VRISDQANQAVQSVSHVQVFNAGAALLLLHACVTAACFTMDLTTLQAGTHMNYQGQKCHGEVPYILNLQQGDCAVTCVGLISSHAHHHPTLT
jgi:hypothetical protein